MKINKNVDSPLSKVLERVVAKELLKFLNFHVLFPTDQSGYRQFHFTESALLEISSFLFGAIDDQGVLILTFLNGLRLRRP